MKIDENKNKRKIYFVYKTLMGFVTVKHYYSSRRYRKLSLQRKERIFIWVLNRQHTYIHNFWLVLVLSGNWHIPI